MEQQFSKELFPRHRHRAIWALAQKALLGENPGKVKGDGSLLKIEAKTLMEAAEATAACLASLLKNRKPQSVVLIRDGDSRAGLVLETALRKIRPGVGRSYPGIVAPPCDANFAALSRIGMGTGRSGSFVAVSDIAFVSHSGHRETKFTAGAQRRTGVRQPSVAPSARRYSHHGTRKIRRLMRPLRQMASSSFGLMMSSARRATRQCRQREPFNWRGKWKIGQIGALTDRRSIHFFSRRKNRQP